MSKYPEIYDAGAAASRRAERYTSLNNREYAAEDSTAPAAYVLLDERFVTSHDDMDSFVEVIDTEERVMESYRLVACKKEVIEPSAWTHECLAYYLSETYGVPVRTGYYPLPKWMNE